MKKEQEQKLTALGYENQGADINDNEYWEKRTYTDSGTINIIILNLTNEPRGYIILDDDVINDQCDINNIQLDYNNLKKDLEALK